jgi:hypothetical protein
LEDERDAWREEAIASGRPSLSEVSQLEARIRELEDERDAWREEAIASGRPIMFMESNVAARLKEVRGG